MKRLFWLVVFIVFASDLSVAQNSRFEESGNDGFSFRVQSVMGQYLGPSGNIVEIDPNAPTGLNFGIEYPSARQRPWQQYLNDPTVGLGMSYLNLGNDVMGEAVALYPYIMIDALDTDYFQLRLKVAAGLTAVNGHYKATVNQEIPNKTFGSLINSYLNAGLGLDIPLSRNLSLNGEFGFTHISNGRTVEPNKGVNILYGGVGLVATLNPEEEQVKKPIKFEDLPYKWSLNITAAAGAQNADMTDDRKFFISTFHVGGVYSLTNWYGVGVGMDVFYNDAIGNETNRGLFCTDHDYTSAEKTRVGLGLNNEIRFGDMVALVDWGVYVINPSRHYYNHTHDTQGHDSKLPLFYKTNGPGSQECFHYIRFGVKYRIWDNWHLQALAKTHRHICEYIEFGLNYHIPFVRKEKRERFGSIFHNSRDWWRD